MAYYTGAAESAASLLSQLKALLPQQGWSVVRDDNLNAGNYGVILQGAGAYYRLPIFTREIPATGPYISWRVAQSYADGDLLGPLQGTSRDYHPYLTFPVIAWHLFISSASFYLVIESVPGRFVHLSLGRLTLVNDLSGGWFNSILYCDFGRYGGGASISGTQQGLLSQEGVHGGNSGREIRINSGVIFSDPDTGSMLLYHPAGWGGTGEIVASWRRWYILSLIRHGASVAQQVKHPDRLRLQASTDPRTGITRLFPMTILCAGSQDRIRYIGEVPNIAVCQLDFVQSGQVLTVDGIEWMVFPRQIRDLSQAHNRIGYAYRVN